jgi:hypothetical protein
MLVHTQVSNCLAVEKIYLILSPLPAAATIIYCFIAGVNTSLEVNALTIYFSHEWV